MNLRFFGENHKNLLTFTVTADNRQGWHSAYPHRSDNACRDENEVFPHLIPEAGHHIRREEAAQQKDNVLLT